MTQQLLRRLMLGLSLLAKQDGSIVASTLCTPLGLNDDAWKTQPRGRFTAVHKPPGILVVPLLY